MGTALPIDWRDIEGRVRPHVKFLRDAGYETTGSCGHEMWITVKCEPMELPALDATLKAGGYRDYELSYTIHHGFDGWSVARVQFGGELKGDGKPFDLVLLKVDLERAPLYFVISARHWPDKDPDPWSSAVSHDAYYYGEHTCPTNWIGDIVAIIAGGDDDPHGFATFVRRCESPPGMTEDGDWEAGSDQVSWRDLFPETVLD